MEYFDLAGELDAAANEASSSSHEGFEHFDQHTGPPQTQSDPAPLPVKFQRRSQSCPADLLHLIDPNEPYRRRDIPLLAAMDMGTEILNNNKNWSSSSTTSASLLPVDEYDDPDRRDSVASTGSTGFAGFLRGRRVSSRRESEESASTSSTGRRDSTPYVVAPSLFLEEKPIGIGSGRRRSWHVTKLDRKRRKGVVSPTDDDTFDRRQKRPSWWNIFVPDHLKHRSSRRASVAQETSQPPTFVPYQRSKSRSVDHGFSTPFDLDALRNTVEGRFQSVGPHRSDTDGVGGSARDLSEKKMGKTVQPINTTTYTVKDSDTLTSVAARFDTTPSELAKMNRLATRLVFPGQVLFVPDRRRRAGSGGGSGGGAGDSGETADGTGSGPGSLDGGGSIGESDDDVLADASPLSASPTARTLPQDAAQETSQHGAPKSGPGHLQRAGHARPRRETEGFLKITVRHITDGQGVVEGVLLVTPNAFMFDPNVSDALVIERGPESYGVFAPMEFVVNAAIYFDIAHMRVGDNAPPKVDAPKPEIYRLPAKQPGEMKSVDDVSNSNLVKDETFPELAPARSSTEEEDGADNDSLCSTRREGNAFPKAFERDLVTPTQMTLSQTWEAEEKNAGTAITTDAPNTDAPNTDALNTDALNTDAPAADAATATEEKKESVGERSNSVSCSDDAYSMQRKLEERRMSSLDHHWAVPKHKWSQESRDADNEAEARTDAEREGDAEREAEREAERDAEVQEGKGPQGDADAGLVKSSCHDSGIDIRDADQVPLPPILPCAKKVFSDADIILAPKSEFVPPITVPITVAPSSILAQLEGSGGSPTSASMLAAAPPGRKKTSSVSFSIDDEVKESPKDEDHDKQESRKNKMLKRLSYPLAWMEGLGAEKEEKDSLPGLPSSADSQSQHSSMFSKVFSRSTSRDSHMSSSPINLVSDLGSGLFLMKTPSEESGGSGGTRGPSPGPPHTPGPFDPPASPEIREVLKEGIETGFSVVGNTATSFISSVSNVGRSSVGTFISRQQTDAKEHKSDRVKQAAPKLDIRSMVSVDDMPELFVSFDKLIPRPARPCDDPPLYLRLRMGKPINREIPRSTQIMSYGKKRMRPEYWFSVPRNRVEDLYKFLMLWIPERYGEVEDMDLAARGYELVESDTELWDDESGADNSGEAGRRSTDDGELRELTRESWELASMSDELRRAIYATNGASFDTDILPPDLIGVTEILTEDHRKELCRHLPARAEGYLWTLVFSTSQHGFSLNSMYRKMQRLESPILMVIQDTNNNVFGALTSCALKVSDHFYGTGESLLFRFHPQFQVYNWTGDNMYFIKGNNESLAIGAGDGRFGLWLDGDLYQGRSQPCNTYGNDALSVNEDFVVKTLECWAFV